MVDIGLIPLSLDLSTQQVGPPQRSGPMTVVPLFGPDTNGKFASPLSDLKLSQVKNYGRVEIENRKGGGTAIVPLHMGHIQDRAQNHALCRSGFVGAGQKLTFNDACCVQESQGGFLENVDAWFFVLPVALREEALALRGREDYAKLWPAIARLSRAFGESERGHLEQIISRHRPHLTQYASRFELLSNQTGAFFLLGDRLVGVEVAPSPSYFSEVWTPLVCFCYGTAAMLLERQGQEPPTEPESLEAADLAGVRRRLDERRAALDREVEAVLAATPPQSMRAVEEERFLDLRLLTAEGPDFVGQVVEEDDRLVYASITARASFLPV